MSPLLMYRLVDMGPDAAPVLVEIAPANDDARLVPLPIEVAVDRLNTHAKAAAQLLELTTLIRKTLGDYADASPPPPKPVREKLGRAQALGHPHRIADALCSELSAAWHLIERERAAHGKTMGALCGLVTDAMKELERRDKRAGKGKSAAAQALADGVQAVFRQTGLA